MALLSGERRDLAGRGALTAETGSECAGRVLRHFPVFTSHILTLSSNWRQRGRWQWFSGGSDGTDSLAPEPPEQPRTAPGSPPPLGRPQTHRARDDEVGLGVEVTAKDVIAVSLQGFQTLSLRGSVVILSHSQWSFLQTSAVS